ncbi:hypothetical protein D7X74_19840 [Corallococcus sp. CA047B]|uniref:hypothetical protein n=1 Tax=Corallococcus sp. CA047B TaxID=2316729 RepID=UPI000E9FFEF7|nr:hypothetical protein [Corallococcus sp. CA047B]RKH14606.1 hypothetical protein D7X74_19840 [Corallococcus sp. CA047B]
MGALNLALEEGGPRSLELRWGSNWRDLEITLDDEPVGAVADKLQLEQGVEFKLPDDSVLHVQLLHVPTPELRVLRNGAPLPDAASDPVQQVRTATFLLYGLAAFSVGVAMVSLVMTSKMRQQLPVSASNLLFGGVLAVLGFFMFKRWRAAPLLAILLYSFDTLSTLYVALTSEKVGGISALTGLVIRIFIFGALGKGFLGARELARREKQPLTAAPPSLGPAVAFPEA